MPTRFVKIWKQLSLVHAQKDLLVTLQKAKQPFARHQVFAIHPVILVRIQILFKIVSLLEVVTTLACVDKVLKALVEQIN